MECAVRVASSATMSEALTQVPRVAMFGVWTWASTSVLSGAIEATMTAALSVSLAGVRDLPSLTFPLIPAY